MMFGLEGGSRGERWYVWEVVFFCFCFVIVSYHCDITSLSNYIKKNIMYRFINFYLVYNKKMDCLEQIKN